MTSSLAEEHTPRRRGPSAGTPARRAQIVDAALASFAEHGYERASLRDIASRAGLTHAALLRHFSGKEELLPAALAQREEHEEDVAARIMTAHVPGEQILSAVLADEFRHPDFQRNWLALSVAATNPDHPAHEFFLGRRQRMRSRFTDGPLPTKENELLTADEKITLVLAMVDGLRIQSLLDPSRDALGLLTIFMKLIAAQPPAATSEGKE
ncbi:MULTISPECIES: TetR/AcrR family transcriptional regulator [unclassified Microbacterium]|uniref:TetR/AcrR family transcriptional regulator n=1 Tax=unclassified Microbacterium TaxID=2609290 RepID=UPI000EA8720B|nr:MULTISPECIES: TetR/AcrR family transcriptional regulator [unclassified Microbacterium]MBT2486585.1 TetR/AcrR family transcriptional regulator [Microbacterium sp. ISL-108]RKN69271.1 TetR/AcrR family transcriptional regulator [Microbacterium sp. CGR2]